MSSTAAQRREARLARSPWRGGALGDPAERGDGAQAVQGNHRQFAGRGVTVGREHLIVERTCRRHVGTVHPAPGQVDEIDRRGESPPEAFIRLAALLEDRFRLVDAAVGEKHAGQVVARVRQAANGSSALTAARARPTVARHATGGV
jgi:hypothetical protein